MAHVPTKQYAQALFDFSENQEMSALVYSDLTQLGALIKQSEDFSNLLNNPVFPKETRKEILHHCLKDKLNHATIQFLDLLNRKGRLNILKEIIPQFIKIYFTNKNIAHAKIITNAPLSKQQISAISHHLKLKFRKEIEAQMDVDPRIIGGLKIIIDNILYDYSFRTQLDNFKNKLVHA